MMGEEEGQMDGLSKETTKKGRLQRACLDLLAEHEADGALPTSSRFLFYELLGRGVVPKVYRHPDGTERPRKPSQDISDAVGVLREVGRIPWTYIADETRTLDSWRYASSVYEYVEDTLPLARINLWDGEPPLILCESRSLAGTVRHIAQAYLCPLAATNGQAGGFLRTEVAPLVEAVSGFARRVLYLGDLDLSGGHIEENTQRVLSEYGSLEWERLAITRMQVEERELLPVRKEDKRFNPPRAFEAVETEALGQTEIMALLTARLDALAPEPLSEVLGREEVQRVRVRERLAGSE
jgi:hypothetical protein